MKATSTTPLAIAATIALHQSEDGWNTCGGHGGEEERLWGFGGEMVVEWWWWLLWWGDSKVVAMWWGDSKVVAMWWM